MGCSKYSFSQWFIPCVHRASVVNLIAEFRFNIITGPVHFLKLRRNNVCLGCQISVN